MFQLFSYLLLLSFWQKKPQMPLVIQPLLIQSQKIRNSRTHILTATIICLLHNILFLVYKGTRCPKSYVYEISQFRA